MLALPLTLSLYLIRILAGWFGVVMGIFSTLIYLFEILELLRRSATKSDVSLNLVFKMGLLKTPSVLEKLIPFFLLLAALLAFRNLQKNFEIIVARASGLSLVQMLAPLLGFAFFLGVMDLFFFNPISAGALVNFERLSTTFIKRQQNKMIFSDNGLWLKQSEQDGEYTLLRAKTVQVAEHTAHNLSFFHFKAPDVFIERIEAKSAQMNEGFWELKDVTTLKPHKPQEFQTTSTFKTSFTPESIEESFTSPDTISFFSLPNYITSLERAGFSGIAHRFHLDSLLVKPFLMISMILLSACFSFKWLGRTHAWGWTVFGTLASGFILYLTNDIFHALALSYTLPLSVSIWGPVISIMMICSAYILHIEHG